MRDKPNPSDDPQEIAWAAGLFEGEGSFHLNRSSSGYVYGRASLGMVDEDVVRHFHRVVGCGTVSHDPQRRDGRQPIWTWSITSRLEYMTVAGLLEPFLGQRRKAKLIEIAGQLTEPIYDVLTGLRSHCFAGHPLTPENTRMEKGDRYCRICLNARRREKRRQAAKRRGSWAGV